MSAILNLISKNENNYILLKKDYPNYTKKTKFSMQQLQIP